MSELTPSKKLLPFSEMTMKEYCAELRLCGWSLSIADDDTLYWGVNRVGCCGIQQKVDEGPEAFHCRALRHARKQVGTYDQSQEVFDQ